MFLVDDRLHWSASDLTAAAGCEFGVLRTLDTVLGRSPRVAVAEDPLLRHIADLGDRHEARLVEQMRAGRSVVELPRVAVPYSTEALQAAREATLVALAGDTDVLVQAALHDGEFFGYADFLERTDQGWMVCDAKLARSAKPQALLQLGAYAAQLDALGVPVAPEVALLLGDGRRVQFPLVEVLPVFEERRAGLRALLAAHREAGAPVRWGDDVLACGRCAECSRAVEEADDLLLVAGLRMDQRRRLREAGTRSVADLAAATDPPPGLARQTFVRLRAQAALQHARAVAGPDAPLTHELTDLASEVLALLPAPSPGDLFFDFEGDPLHDEGDPSQVGLEYLWGFVDAEEKFTGLWAHDRVQERVAFEQFIDLVTERRAVHPDMHVYHYAPYETTALKRLATRYQTREDELDELLRGEVFVDLYATVRGAVRVSVPSYSIKQLEPLYMGSELRSDDEDAVGDGGASVVAYHQYRALRDHDPDAAQRRLEVLEDYNAYDCLSTLRLRDWLLDRAVEAGVRHRVVPREDGPAAGTGTDIDEESTERDELFEELVRRSGPATADRRTAEQQAWAMLAAALDFHRREDKQFWWEHFDRLHHPVDEWAGTRDVFRVESVEVVQDWTHPGGRKRNLRRILRLTGDWAPGSTPGSGAQVVYRAPTPPGAKGPESALHGAAACQSLDVDAGDPRTVLLTESRPPDQVFGDLPVALAPAMPPPARPLPEAIAEVARAAVAGGPGLPPRAALDVLARRRPRLRGGAALPPPRHLVDDAVAALLAMDDSYLAVQGPPGTGKTYSGSRIIRRLVEEHGWRVGIVAQSHAVVENMLDGIVRAGLDPARVAKFSTRSDRPTWTDVTDVTGYLEDHEDGGCVIGGTAWLFANGDRVARDSLDLLVVDEAGQFNLACTLAASVAARRLLLLGDPRQLPQVSQGSHPEPVGDSALGWLMQEHATLPRDLGYFLTDSYRMHPAVCAAVSRLSYDGELESASPPTARRLEGVEPGVQIVTVRHAGNRAESPEEAEVVRDQVQRLLGRRWTAPDEGGTPRPLGQRDFVVVAPFNAQVARIRRTLAEAGLDEVRVGTVDRFQGQEAPVVLVSMAASSAAEVPRGMSFLLNRNRVNVAISRAKWLAVLVRSADLTSYLPATTEGVLELGAFIGLCRDGGEPTPATTPG